MTLRTVLVLAAAATAVTLAAAAAPRAPAPLPARLSETGLFVAGTTRPAPGVLSFSPQYPLWTDGARKRRWIALPPGATIDARQADAWDFPPGTKLWKEFGYGRAVETRLIERLGDGTWRFAAYVWNADGSDADLAPADGASVAVADAPAAKHSVPSRTDCLACHEGGATPVLGFSALQLSPDRDPQALHAEPPQPGDVDLARLVQRGLVRGLPATLLATPPRIDAPTPTARAALGYLHGNCGHCHNAAGALTGLELVLAQQAERDARSVERTLQSLLGHSSRFRPHDGTATQRVAAGHGASVLTLRMKSDNKLARMPPLGVQVIDTEGAALVERWIARDLQPALTSR